MLVHSMEVIISVLSFQRLFISEYFIYMSQVSVKLFIFV